MTDDEEEALFRSLTNAPAATLPPAPELTIERLLEAQREIAALTFPGSLLIRWMIAPHMPLEREQPDGSRTPVFCWRVSEIYLVHPDRADRWRAWLAEAGHANEQLDHFPEGPIGPVPFEGFSYQRNDR